MHFRYVPGWGRLYQVKLGSREWVKNDEEAKMNVTAGDGGEDREGEDTQRHRQRNYREALLEPVSGGGGGGGGGGEEGGGEIK